MENPLMEQVVDVLAARGNLTRDEIMGFIEPPGSEDNYEQHYYETHVVTGINSMEDELIDSIASTNGITREEVIASKARSS